MKKKPLALLVGLVGLVVVAVLAFGVFGVQTLFTDDKVSEDGPFFAGDGESGLASDALSDELVADMNADMEGSVDDEMSDPEPAMDAEILRVIEGTFIGRSHPGEGTAVVLTDGSPQRFLRLEEDFLTDNGPDLNVYLVADASADADKGTLDDDFIDLGDLKGNIGSQNYELSEDVDLERYNTVVIWCVRFGVAFAAADLT